MRDLPAPVYVSWRACAGSRTTRGRNSSCDNDLLRVAFRAIRRRIGPPKFILLSRLNIQPARLPVNASPLLSRTTTHDSGPIWFATPSLGGTCTRETYRFVPAHREVKILMRLPRLKPISQSGRCRPVMALPTRLQFAIADSPADEPACGNSACLPSNSDVNQVRNQPCVPVVIRLLVLPTVSIHVRLNHPPGVPVCGETYDVNAEPRPVPKLSPFEIDHKSAT